jgi:hypothetical protein
MRLPLEDVTVIDLSHALAGPGRDRGTIDAVNALQARRTKTP